MTQTRCPEHYRFGSLQAKDIIEQVISPIRDAVRAYHTATALKYLLRHTRKAGVGDLLKCRDHLNWAIARAQGAPHEVAADSMAWRHGDIDKVCGDPRTGVSFSIKPEMGRNLPTQGIRDAGESTHELRPRDSTAEFTQQTTFDTCGAWPSYDPYRECAGRVVGHTVPVPPCKWDGNTSMFDEAPAVGEFTQPPNCSPGVSDVANRLHLSTSADTSEHPMHAVALEMAETAIASRTLPGEVGN